MTITGLPNCSLRLGCIRKGMIGRWWGLRRGVKDDSVAFGVGANLQLCGGRVSGEVVGVPHSDLAAFVERMLDLVKEVLSHRVVVELMGATNIKGKTTDFTVHLCVLGPVSVTLVIIDF